MKNFLKENWFKIIIISILFLVGNFVVLDYVSAHPGNTAADGCHYCRTNCDKWGVPWNTRHCHGGGPSSPSIPDYGSNYSYPATPSCPSMSSYDSLSGSCKCYSGYVVGKDILGKESCISADQKCRDDYGYNSRYNSLSNSCECSYGYVFGKDSIGRTQCVSQDSICTNQLGYNAKYNSLYDKCECLSGYVISGGRCVDGDSVCRSKHGLYSSYNGLDKSCECDSGYALDDSSQCVKKQNNAYFTLKELDTDARKAIIRSGNDYRYYLISYNSGCYPSSLRRYLNQQIVVNLGTDFDLDAWDKIVLQDDNETCDITRVERAYSDTTLKPEEENIVYYPSFAPTPSPTPTPTPTPIVQQTPQPAQPTPQVIAQIATQTPKPIIKSSPKPTETSTPTPSIRIPFPSTTQTPEEIKVGQSTPTPEASNLKEKSEPAKINILASISSIFTGFFSKIFKFFK